MEVIKVENDTLARDPVTGAIVETDTSKLNKYRSRRSAIKQKDEAITLLSERINRLEQLIERMTTSNG